MFFAFLFSSFSSLLFLFLLLQPSLVFFSLYSYQKMFSSFQDCHSSFCFTFSFFYPSQNLLVLTESHNCFKILSHKSSLHSDLYGSIPRCFKNQNAITLKESSREEKLIINIMISAKRQLLKERNANINLLKQNENQIKRSR